MAEGDRLPAKPKDKLMTMIVGKENINNLRVQMGIRAIALEIVTGMKPTRGFVAKTFAQSYGYEGPATKKKVLAWLVENTAFEVEPGSMIEKALAK